MNKILSRLICIAVVVLNVIVCCTNANAASGEFEVFQSSQESFDQRLESIDFQVVTDSGPLSEFTEPIVSFDISMNGQAALALDDDQIIIIDDNGKLTHHYKFSAMESYHLRWKGENVQLFLVRSDLIVEFSLDGQVIAINEWNYGNLDNRKLYNEIQYRRNVTVDDIRYTIRNDMGIFNAFNAYRFSQLVKTDMAGNVTILYDVTRAFKTKIIIILCFALIILTGVVVTLVKTIRRFIEADMKGGISVSSEDRM